jgi:chromosome segregation ATPase
MATIHNPLSTMNATSLTCPPTPTPQHSASRAVVFVLANVLFFSLLGYTIYLILRRCLGSLKQTKFMIDDRKASRAEKKILEEKDTRHEADLTALKAKYEKLQEEMDDKTDGDGVAVELVGLKDDFNCLMAENEKLVKDGERVGAENARSKQSLEGLGEEKKRWIAKKSELETNLGTATAKQKEFTEHLNKVTTENNERARNLEQITKEKIDLANNLDQVTSKKEELQTQVETLTTEKKRLQDASNSFK